MSIPADFQPHYRKSPATDPWEPLFSRQRDGGVDLAFEVRPAHCNSRGLLHGGVLAALCDSVMGHSLGTVIAREVSIITINLTLDYLGSAKLGDLVVITPRVIHAGTSLGTCDALAVTGSRTIARANASFTVRAHEARQAAATP